MSSGASQAGLSFRPPPPPPLESTATGLEEVTTTPAVHIETATPDRVSGHNTQEGSDRNLLESAKVDSVATRSPAPVQGNPESTVETAVAPSLHPHGRVGRCRILRWIFTDPINTSEAAPHKKKRKKEPHERTYWERLKPTYKAAEAEKVKYEAQVKWLGNLLSIAIGLQVFLGALTTAVSAALQSGKQVQIATAILGGASTMVASYLAKTRGSKELQIATERVKDLEYFMRDCKGFKMDHGHERGSEKASLNKRIADLRQRFEELIGNGGERKLLGSAHGANN
ncbi:hypothetical protein ID866_10902, partial [Astraeus odoratus]